MDRLKGKKEKFCRWYLALGNVREAALKAGCPPETAADDGLQMLRSDYCRRVLARLAQEPPLPAQALVAAGLQRLAFGEANDAVRLVFADAIPEETLQGLDLFHVTSIKCDKNGIEVRLADRLAAMEKLLECAGNADHAAAAAALFSALQGAAGEVDADASGKDAGDSAVLP